MQRWTRYTLIAAALAVLMALEALAVWNLAARQASRTVSAPATAALETGDALMQFRVEREQLRAKQEAQLNDIVYSDRSDAETVARAQDQLLSLLTHSEQETTLEGILQTRGFDDAVVSVGERSANVLVRREALTQRETAVILELVMRETGLTGGNVKIIPVK